MSLRIYRSGSVVWHDDRQESDFYSNISLQRNTQPSVKGSDFPFPRFHAHIQSKQSRRSIIQEILVFNTVIWYNVLWSSNKKILKLRICVHVFAVFEVRDQKIMSENGCQQEKDLDRETMVRWY